MESQAAGKQQVEAGGHERLILRKGRVRSHRAPRCRDERPEGEDGQDVEDTGRTQGNTGSPGSPGSPICGAVLPWGWVPVGQMEFGTTM